MKDKGFLSVLILTAVICLVSSSAFGQISQDVSIAGGNLWSSYNLDSSFSLSPFLQSSSYDYTYTNPFLTTSNQSSYYNDLFSSSSSSSSSFTNPFATTSNESSYYNDLFSNAWDQSYSYQNAFGFGYSSGSSAYNDLFYSQGSQYANMSAPGSLYSTEYDYSRDPFGGSNSYNGTLSLPWTTFSSSVNSSYGMDAFPYAAGYTGSSVAFGTPTAYSLFGRATEGIADLVSYAPISAQLDRALGDQPMYTAEGMPFYATASYFNPYNASNYYFAPGATIAASGITPGGYVGSASMYAGIGALPGGIAGGGLVGGGLVGGGLVGGGAMPGGAYSGGTGSPAAGGFSAAGFSSIIY